MKINLGDAGGVWRKTSAKAKTAASFLKNCAKAAKSKESATIVAVALILTLLPITALLVGSWIIISGVFSGKLLYQAAAALGIYVFARGFFGLLARMWVRTVVLTPKVTRSIILRFGERTGRVLDEGLGFKWFFEEVDSESVALREESFRLEFQVEGEKPNIPEWMVCEGRFRFRTDPEVKDDDNRSVCLEVGEEEARHGTTDHIKQKLETLGPHFTAQSLKKKQPALADFLESFLRLEIMPHPHGETLIGDILDWYTKNRGSVKTALKKEHGLQNKRSEVEKLFGVDIIDLEITYLDYTEETLERKKAAVEAEENAKALQTRTRGIKEMIAAGLDAGRASQQVMVAFDDRVVPTVTSIEGLENASAVIVPTNIFGTPPRKTRNNDGSEADEKGGGK